MRPFPIYPLYTQTVILSLDKPIADCFLFSSSKSREKRRKRSHINVSNTLVTRTSRVSQTPPQTPHVRFSQTKAGVHTRLSEKIAHKGTHGETRGVSDGVVSLPSVRSARSQTSPGRVSEQQTLPLLGLGLVCSQRTQRACGTAMRMMRVAVPQASPLGCVIFSVSVEIYGFTPRTQGFLCVRGGGGITTPGARCVLPKVSAPACQSGLFAVF